MPGNFYLREILIFLAAAVIVGPLFKRFKLSPVLGYLFAGLVIGPFGLSFISDVEGSKVLGHFGVVFLLFTIGLELPWQRLKVLRRYVFGLGATQVVLTCLVIAVTAIILKVPTDASIVIGAGLALSSTAMVVQVLTERGEMAARFGRVAFSILLFQDIAVVGFLVLIPILAQDGSMGESVVSLLGTALLRAAATLVVIALVGRWILRPIYRIVAASRNAEVFTAMSLLLIMGLSLATEMAGLSMELGAFLAGLLLAETEYRHQVEADIEPFKGLLLGLFFMSVGMSIDMSLIAQHFGVITLIIVLMITGKALILEGLCYLFGLSLGAGMRVGFLLAAGGEFAFVLFSPAVDLGILNPELEKILFISVVLSMCLTPLLASFGKFISNAIEEEVGVALKAAADETVDFKDHVIIAGLGGVGEIVSRLLTEQLVPFVAIDLDMKRVERGRDNGMPVFFGDARRAEVLRALGASRARAAVVTLEQKAASTRAVATLKRNFPDIEIFVRVHDEQQAEKVKKMGAIPVVPETLEPSLHLAASVLNTIGISSDQIRETIETFRRHHIPVGAPLLRDPVSVEQAEEKQEEKEEVKQEKDSEENSKSSEKSAG